MLMELPYPDVGNLTWGWLGPLLLLLVLDVDLETQASAVSDILEVVLCCQSHFILPLQNQNQNSNKCLQSHHSPCLPLLKRIWPWALINSGRSYNCTDYRSVHRHVGSACDNYAILAILGTVYDRNECYVYLLPVYKFCPGFFVRLYCWKSHKTFALGLCNKNQEEIFIFWQQQLTRLTRNLHRLVNMTSCCCGVRMSGC